MSERDRQIEREREREREREKERKERKGERDRACFLEYMVDHLSLRTLTTLSIFSANREMSN